METLINEKNNMKIGIIGDLHFGCHGNSRHMRKFMQNYLLKKLQYFVDNDIENIVFVGDIFHSRTTIHIQDISFFRNELKDFIIKNEIGLNIVVGNHDCHYKNTNEMNSPELLLNDYAIIHKTPVQGNGIDFIPWINPENEQKVNDIVANTKSKYCFGHFELFGFQFSENVYSKDGMDASLLKNYDKVISGHFHIKNSGGNIEYVGTPYATTWTEYNTKKGVHILDTGSGDLEFIENDPADCVFIKVDYIKEPKFDFKDLSGKIVQCNIIEKSTPAKMKKFFEQMGEINVIKLTYNDLTEIEKSDIDIVELDEVGSNINDAIIDYGNENEVDNEVVNYAIGLVKSVEEIV